MILEDFIISQTGSFLQNKNKSDFVILKKNIFHFKIVSDEISRAKYF